MNPEMHKEIQDTITREFAQLTLSIGDHIQQSVQGAVKVTVNGKIDKMQVKMDDFILKVNPALAAFESGDKVVRFVIWLAKFMAALGTIYGAWVFFKLYLIEKLK